MQTYIGNINIYIYTCISVNVCAQGERERDRESERDKYIDISHTYSMLVIKKGRILCLVSIDFSLSIGCNLTLAHVTRRRIADSSGGTDHDDRSPKSVSRV